jgi:uncharacterized cupredoxin-like copper-binding protein
MAWNRTVGRWAWLLALVPVLLAVPLVAGRRHGPQPAGTPVKVRLADFRVRPDRASVPAGAVRFDLVNNGPSTHELIVVRTDRTPGRLPLQRDGLTVDEEAPGLHALDEAEGLDIADHRTLLLRLPPGHYVLFCNMEGHYLGGMHAALTVG